MSTPTIYICLETFTAGNGRRFKKDETVSSFVVSTLKPEDRKKFKPKESESFFDTTIKQQVQNDNSVSGVFVDTNLIAGAEDIAPVQDKSAEDTPVFGGWGGGDTGGGGASQNISEDNSSSSSSDSGYSSSSDSGGSSYGGGSSGD